MISYMNTQEMKERLEGERVVLEAELATVGTKNEAVPGDWTPKQDVMDVGQSDEIADSIENFEANTAIVKELEIQLGNVKRALDRIESGTYGVCEISGGKIEDERLRANPSARTCMKHLAEESGLPR